MKRFSLLLLAAACVFGLSAQTPKFNPSDLDNIVAAEKKAHTGKHAIPEGFSINDNFDVRYHRIEWQLDPAVKYIGGAVTTYFESKVGGLFAVHFDLMDALSIDSARYHGAPISFAHDNNIVTVWLPQPMALGALDSLTLYYQGAPAETGFGSFEQTTHNGVPIVWSLSEPYGARDWWPCKQDLNDKIDSLDVYVTCPQAYRAAGNGILASEYPDGPGLKTYHWKHRHPIACYLVAVAVTNYAQYIDYAELSTGPMPILNYVYPEVLTSAQDQTPDLVPVIEFYDSLFIPYPFHDEKYGHAQFGWGGGMEHQTMTFLVNFGYELMAHELAHQWFGDHVTCGSWEDIWLNEGFATYLSMLCYERFSFNTYWKSSIQQRLNSVTSQAGGSVWVDDTTSVNRIFDGRLSYSKGALILHQLRWVIGDEPFFSGLRNYLNANGISGEFAYTNDLRSHLEATSGKNLEWYFNDWVYEQGFPSYQIQWGASGTTVQVTINQTQSVASSGFWNIPVPLRFTNGAQSFNAMFTPTANGQSFQATLPFTPTNCQFDPDIWLISANNTVTKVTVGTETASEFTGHIFPNPTSGRVSISAGQEMLFDGQEMLFDKIEVFDTFGKLVYELSRPNSGSFDLDLTNLPPGVYQARLSNDTNTATAKVLRQ